MSTKSKNSGLSQIFLQSVSKMVQIYKFLLSTVEIQSFLKQLYKIFTMAIDELIDTLRRIMKYLGLYFSWIISFCFILMILQSVSNLSLIFMVTDRTHYIIIRSNVSFELGFLSGMRNFSLHFQIIFVKYWTCLWIDESYRFKLRVEHWVAPMKCA